MRSLARPLAVAALAATGLLGGAGRASADLTFTLGTVLSGNTPSGTPPWIKAVLSQKDSDTVRFTLTGPNLTGSEFIDDWLFNYTGDASGLSFAKVGGAGNTTLALGSFSVTGSNNAYQQNGDSGNFDIKFQFQTSNGVDRFTVGDKVVVDVTLTGGGVLAVGAFNTYSVIQKNKKPDEPTAYYSSAHIQGLSPEGSSKIVGGPGVNAVPEPSLVAMGAAGFAGLVGIRRRFSNKA